MKFSVTILGSSAAVPTKRRNPTAQLLNVQGKLMLIDCAEGTQLQLTRCNVPIQKIGRIFISHMHGDHYYGLVGLISKYHLIGRKRRLHVYGPPGLIGIIEINLKESQTRLNYPLEFHPLRFESPGVIFEDDILEVTTVPLVHSVPTNGFLFREKSRLRNINKDFANSNDLSYSDIQRIKRGHDYINEEGRVYKSEDITRDPPAPRSYAYLTDTAYNPAVITTIRGVDLLYHEATFGDEFEKIATDKQHSTARQAAIIAREAGVGKLILGHFSARYRDITPLVNQAREEFPETYAAEDGQVYEVPVDKM